MPETTFFLRHPLPTYRVWLREWTRQHDEIRAKAFLDRVEGLYVELYAHSKRHSPRGLQKLHFEKNILPAIAAYQVLLAEGNSSETAQAALDDLLAVTISEQKRMYRFWGRFPFFFDFLRWTLKPLTLSQYPREGWRMDFPDLGPDVTGLDSHSCFYLHVLTEYGYPELTRHFCHLDDVLFEGVTPYIRFERT